MRVSPIAFFVFIALQLGATIGVAWAAIHFLGPRFDAIANAVTGLAKGL
jgi:hypothetical protein